MLTILVVVVLWSTGVLRLGFPGTNVTADQQGGQAPGAAMAEARTVIDQESTKREVLERQEEILRYQFSLLEQSLKTEPSPEKQKELAEAREQLLEIIGERQRAEALITASLLELWESEGVRFSLTPEPIAELLDWPVLPRLGISARFHDSAYEERFGLVHNAIDIPVEQGSRIMAPAAGTVERVALNGLGYSYVTLSHGNDLKTTYGHISASLVMEGDTVFRGQAIALSGGQPGTPGAGLLTTGPHLHFAVLQKGLLVDPLAFLPEIDEL